MKHCFKPRISCLLRSKVTTPPYSGKSPHGWSVEEVSLAGMPKASLQGRINGVFRNKPPVRARVVTIEGICLVFRIKIYSLIAILVLMSGLLQSGDLLARVSLDEATREVEKKQGGRVLSAKTVELESREVHVIRVLTTEGRIQHFKVDADTGHDLANKADKK